MPDSDDLQERLAAMAERRVAGADRPAHLPARSRRRIRRGERIATGLATLVVVALVAGGVALARSGQEQATTVRVGPPSGAAACYPPGIPRALADKVRELARGGTPIPHVSPRAEVAALPATASPQVTVDLHALGGWVVVITGRNFANGIMSLIPPAVADGMSYQLDPGLQVWATTIPASLSSVASLDPIAVSWDPSCTSSEPGTSERSSTTVPPANSTSTTTGVTTPGAPIGRGTPPDCTGSRLSLTAATDKASYAIGDTVTITVTIRNDGATCENASRAAALDTCPLIRVADAAGQAVYDPGVFCPVPLRLAPVPAGYHRSDTFTWISGQVSPPCTGASCDVQATAGTYRVTPSDPGIDGIKIHPTTIALT